MACKGIDAQVVRPEDPELASLLNQFVPARIVDFKGVDMNQFRFDYDLTFAALMMDADGRTYARYGSQDFRSSADRISIAGLKRAMRQVLAEHAKPRPEAAGPTNLPRRSLQDMPVFTRSRQAKAECYHCHFANNARFAELRAEGKFTKELLFQYPLPDNIGVVLEVDRNNVAQSIVPASPAERAGIRPGDTIIRAGSTRVYSSGDLQFALDSVPDPGKVVLEVERGGKRLPPATLTLPKDWRRSDISWRPSVGNIPPTVGIWAVPLTADERRQRGLEASGLALRVSFFSPGPVWARTRGDLRMNDVIVGVNGEKIPEMTTRQFHSYFRLRFNVGDTATLNVLRGSERIDIPVPCLEVPQ